MSAASTASLSVALILLAIQGALGAWDTLYYHEWLLRLPSKPHARTELALHAARDFAYAVIFGTLGWLAWNGALAWLLLALLVAEIAITLWDFVEEDRTRRLPPGERIGHAVMGIMYGVFLAYLLPSLFHWMHATTGFARVEHGGIAWLLTAMAAGVLLSGLRDLASSLARASAPHHASPVDEGGPDEPAGARSRNRLPTL